MALTITAFGNQKGGVGKTAITATVAEELARRELRVLVVDADPQANLTAQLGIEVGENLNTLNEVLRAAQDLDPVDEGVIVEAIMDAGDGWRGLVDLVPARLELANREQDHVIGAERRLAHAMAGDELASRYDHVLIDCPPSLGQLTVNALVAADQVVCVTEPRASSMEGLAQMRRTVAKIARAYNQRLTVAAIAINKHRTDRIDRVAWAEKLEAQLGAELAAWQPSWPAVPPLAKPFVPEREWVARAATEAIPLAQGKWSHRGTSAVQDVVEAVGAIADAIIAGGRR